MRKHRRRISRRTANGTSGVFTANTDTEEEAVSGESGQHAGDAAVSAIGASGESSEDEEDDGGSEDGPLAGEAIGGVAEDDDTNDFTDEDEGGDVALGVAGLVLSLVELLQNGVDGADNAIEIAVGEQTGTASDDGSAALPPGLLGLLERGLVDNGGGVVLLRSGLEMVCDSHGCRTDMRSGERECAVELCCQGRTAVGRRRGITDLGRAHALFI